MEGSSRATQSNDARAARLPRLEHETVDTQADSPSTMPYPTPFAQGRDDQCSGGIESGWPTNGNDVLRTPQRHQQNIRHRERSSRQLATPSRRRVPPSPFGSPSRSRAVTDITPFNTPQRQQQFERQQERSCRQLWTPSRRRTPAAVPFILSPRQIVDAMMTPPATSDGPSLRLQRRQSPGNGDSAESSTNSRHPSEQCVDRQPTSSTWTVERTSGRPLSRPLAPRPSPAPADDVFCATSQPDDLRDQAQSRAPTPQVSRDASQSARQERERLACSAGAGSPSRQPQPRAEAPSAGLSARSIAQRARRERERLAREAGAGSPSRQPHPRASPPSAGLSARSIAQRARRARERAGRDQPSGAQRRPPVPDPRHVDSRPAPGNTHTRSPDRAQANPRRRLHTIPIARQPYREPAARHDLGRMDVRCRYCNALHWIDERVQDSSVTAPRFGMCCDHGQVRLPALPEPPQLLKDLFVGDDPVAKEFREHIRSYNSALAFTSLGVHIEESINNGRGPYTFVIRGELCHRIGSLLPAEGTPPSYAQLYIYDPQAALDQRMHRNNMTRRDTMERLQTLLSEHHQYATVYRHAHEILEREGGEEVVIRLHTDPTQDRRRYNLPTADEIAVIIPDVSQPTNRRDIILRKREGPLRRISDGHPAYAPLHYVLLFPYGTHGWEYDLRLHQPDKAEPARLSQTRFYAYRLQTRPGEFPTILHGGRLLQQYIVDAWASADQSRLSFLRRNQSKLRASLYSGLADAMHAGDENVDLNNLGQRYILPSSYVGGPRYMQQLFQDAMAIGRYYQKIDIFLTATANPSWPEITRELLAGQTASDRPDLVARVFRLKIKAILHDIRTNGIFGRTVAHVFTIEFQKRGLPHMHLLIFLDEPFKIRDSDDIDSMISAQWPDPVTQPMLFETVKKCMVHGPCGAANPSAPCMENGRCSKNYPKAFNDRTTMDADGYPQYFRPDNGVAYEVRGHMVDNRWIVPYSPYLTAKYDCHINVECAVSFSSIKYVTKYLHKGHDRATLQVNREDEILWYINARYVSGSESSWRIYHFETHGQDPNVVRLQVHLPGQHMVAFDPDEDPAIVLARAGAERTMLTAFFAANADPGGLGDIARAYTYQEFPQHFVWKADNKCWTARQRGFALGRMYFVSPTAGERFYLRTLLTVVRGARSFEDLRTVDGTVYDTFRESCLARGLLEDNGEWRQCLEEATVMQTGTRLRYLFATILMFCQPTDPRTLWNEFRNRICDDLPFRLRAIGVPQPTEDQIYDYGLHLLNNILRESGRSLEDFPPMPLPQADWNIRAENQFIAEQLNYDREFERSQALERIPQLNDDQRQAYDRIIQSVENHLGTIFFLNGPGGTGKTFVYNTVCHKVRSEGWIALCVASSGVAALLLKGGRTSHSMFKIPVDGLMDSSICTVDKQSKRADLFRQVDIIIWDEAVMQHRWGPEAVDRTLRDIRDVDQPFGGTTVVFGGDFQQILPVVVRGSREDIIDASLQRSYLWEHIKVLRLRRNMRLNANEADSQEFAEWLLDVGHGRHLDDSQRLHLPDSMQCESTDALIDFIYDSINTTPPPPPEYFLNRTILAPRNNEVNTINSMVLDRLAGEEQVFVSADTAIAREGELEDGDDLQNFPPEFLRSLSPSGLPLGELHIKIGCPLILLRNITPSRGLCNGTRMVLLRASNRVLEVKIIGGEFHGEIALLPRIVMNPSSSNTEFAFTLKRRQFPVRLAFAMTINKAQGQSVKRVGVDLRSSVFSHGQLYVALSRATSSQHIKVCLAENIADMSATNIVYPEVLLD